MRTEYLASLNNNIQISFPVLPKAKSPIRFALLRAWLRWCNESYNYNRYYIKSNTELPTRLLYVSNPDNLDYNPNVLHLDYNLNILRLDYNLDDPNYNPDNPDYYPNILYLDYNKQIDKRKYITLSHC